MMVVGGAAWMSMQNIESGDGILFFCSMIITIIFFGVFVWLIERSVKR